jgi:hypothetical protein
MLLLTFIITGIPQVYLRYTSNLFYFFIFYFLLFTFNPFYFLRFFLIFYYLDLFNSSIPSLTPYIYHYRYTSGIPQVYL